LKVLSRPAVGASVVGASVLTSAFGVASTGALTNIA